VLWHGIDAGLIDGTVNGVGRRSRGAGSILRLIQSGNIRSYAAWVVLGSIVLLLAIGFAGGLR
jgi:NADH-quinone oxidoreductase subunit L